MGDRRLSILFDRLRWEEKELLRAAQESRLSAELVDAKELRLDSSLSGDALVTRYGEVVLQRCISFYRALHLSAFLESKGLKVINGSSTLGTCGNKLLTTLALTRAGVPTPRTLLAFTPESAMQAIDEMGYPVVLKPLVGSWGRMVIAVRDRETAQAIIEMKEQLGDALDHIYYVQEMVPSLNRDIRTIVAGEKLVAAVYRISAPGEWRANVARGAKTEPCPKTGELEEIVLKAARSVGGGVLGIDLMESPRGLVVHEVNGTVEFRGASMASATDIAAEIVGYVASQM